MGEPDWLHGYRERGFVLLPGLVAPAALERIESRFLALARGDVEPAEKMILMRDVEVVKGDVEPASAVHAINKLLSFEDDPVLFEHALDASVLEAVRAIIGRDVMTISTNVFNKPPGVDGRHPLHQDLRYFTLRPPDGIVATWTAISPCTRENGCLCVVPGSHRGPLLRHGDPDWDNVNYGFFAAQDVDLDARVHVEMQPGDTLLFHPLLVHGSGRNQTDGFRRAVSVHYASTACTRASGPHKREPVTRVIPAA